ncbi:MULTISPECIES: TraR/DksA C4-type zinc finger protein [unclassified Pseudomonas]|uniref:TraR/DksA C4-type zinc finger protein n=1 Tax=unclassified Pseudomonas TaxID=196821 RepID=UPI00244C6A28|nr:MULTISPECIES: TraR/DksA C4-type zinc finger protein [unclassified Pseudomonas]MDG9925452.1 TraR/DksA C4-type zinc finger protein [Pseudomonas sp. GD04045]MDH0034107.1 TraR/DksA C4-type zinc finger protein [Pseudomonas sp. GD04019]
MADNADIANDLMLERIEQQLAARQPAQGGASAEDCEGCGVAIPPARLQAMAGRGCLRCIECQQDHERKGGRG